MIKLTYATTTTTYWDVDGVPLNTYAWNIETKGGSRGGVPTHAGENQALPYRAGSIWREKVPEARALSLEMWVIGKNDDGTESTEGQERQYNENMALLRTMFWRFGGQQFALTKRWKDPTTGSVISATAQAELVGPLEPTMFGPNSCDLSVDLVLADPFFYGDTVNTIINAGAPATTLFLAGDSKTTGNNLTLTFNGELVSPTLSNSTPDPDIAVQVGAVIDVGDSIVLNVNDFTATRSSDSENVIGTVAHTGARQWMVLHRGNNVLTLTSLAGSGNVVLSHKPVYL